MLKLFSFSFFYRFSLYSSFFYDNKNQGLQATKHMCYIYVTQLLRETAIMVAMDFFLFQCIIFGKWYREKLQSIYGPKINSNAFVSSNCFRFLSRGIESHNDVENTVIEFLDHALR